MVVSEVVRYSAICGCPVRATNQCVQTAQLEEGEKGKVITMNFRVESKLRTRLWYTYKNTLAGFMVTCFCTIYSVSTMSTKTNSISWIKTHLLQKFNPLKFSVIQ